MVHHVLTYHVDEQGTSTGDPFLHRLTSVMSLVIEEPDCFNDYLLERLRS